jgi:GDPmannose 4,6-dehydratase
MSQKTALICGVSGQDGSFLARLLLEKGYRVVGTSRDAYTHSFSNLHRLGIRERVETRSLAPNDFRSVLQVLTSVEPAEIYYLAGQSSVGLSFDQPIETMQSISEGVMNLLEAMRFLKMPARLFHAASSEAFGETPEPADEQTPFRPRSPYGIAKATAYWLVSSYREAYGLHACNGILFNHESPFRPDRFVTMKIVAAAARIAAGSGETLRLGNLEIERDWGWAPEYVDAMWRVLQQPVPGDFVLGSGTTHRLRDFVEKAFALAGLDWNEHVVADSTLFRPYDIGVSRANPSKAARVLGWRATTSFDEMMKLLFESACSSLGHKAA